MKKAENYRTMMGFLIYMLANLTDRFIIKIPALIYVGIIVVAIIFVLSYLLFIIKDNTIAIRLWAFFTSLYVFLIGTKEVVAKNNKKGYYTYITELMGLVGLWLMNNNYS